MRWKVYATAVALMLCVPAAARAASDEQKKHAYEIVERNAAPIAVVGDCLYYLAELGLQEFESA